MGDPGWNERKALLPELVGAVAELVRAIIEEVRPRLVAAAVSGERGERVNERHSDNFLSQFDIMLHHRYRELLTQILPSFVYVSEEADPQVVGNDPDPEICVLVDPLDTSELAVRALNAYTQVLLYSRRLRRPVAAVVGDVFHYVQLYVAGRTDDGSDQAFIVTSGSDILRMRRPEHVRLSDALVTNFLMKPEERFVPLARQERLISALARVAAGAKPRGRIGLDFGSVGLCHVAAGFTDAMVEFAKGFAIWDLMPGQYVLKAAGGHIVDLDGHDLAFDHSFDTLERISESMKRRQRFIAARSPDLAAELAAHLTL